MSSAHIAEHSEEIEGAIAIVGLGSIGRRHLHNLRSLGIEQVVAVRSNKMSDNDLNLPVETSLEQAIERWNVSGVVVANPSAFHIATATTALRAGCSVLIEKPVAVAIDANARRLLAALAESSGVLVGYQFRFDERLKCLRALISSGELGEPVHLSVSWGEYLPTWHPSDDYRQSYSARPELGGGVLLTLSHPIDYLRWLLDDEVSTVMSNIYSTGFLDIAANDSADLLLQFSRCHASIHLDYFRQPRVHRLEVTCTQGSASWDGWASALTVCTANSSRRVEVEAFDRNELFLAEMTHFLQVVAGTAAPICTLEDGLRAVQVVEAAVRSAATGTRVTVSSGLGV